jgi:nitrite reductase (NO-forming)
MKSLHKSIIVSLLFALALTACGNKPDGQSADAGGKVEYVLSTSFKDGRMVFVGVEGAIAGIENPTLKANVGDTVKITLSSGEGIEHDISFPDFNVMSDHVVGTQTKATLVFTPDHGGSFKYFCTLPGHRQAGMEGNFEVTGPSLAAEPAAETGDSEDHAASMRPSGPVVVNNPAASGADIVRDPTDLPAPLEPRQPTNVRIDLETIEVEGQLADGTTFKYWTFNGQVPGPFLRVRVGDAVEVHLKNLINSSMGHSVDFHAVTGPGGGAVMTQTQPGAETMFTFKALNPGLFVYHCATPMVAQHIANGMYGLILVEPEGGLPVVDREFYVMQGEIYTNEAFGSTGLLTENIDALLDEDPEYLVFNGAADGLTAKKPLTANVGETVRIFFGVGGPNFTSSFHVIGEIFDRVYEQASLTTDPLTDVQTTTVPPGGATMVEFKLEVPGNYILVDHALARLQRGLAGFLVVQGAVDPEIFDGEVTSGSGH